jgi:serine/threonine protein kinase
MEHAQSSHINAMLAFKKAGLIAQDEGIECYLDKHFCPVRLGDIYGHYKVIRKLGAGSYSTVWLAEDVRLHRRGHLTNVAEANVQLLSKFLPTMPVGESWKLCNELAQSHCCDHFRLLNSLSNCLTILSTTVQMERIFAWFSS